MRSLLGKQRKSIVQVSELKSANTQDEFAIDGTILNITIAVQRIPFINNPFGNRESRLTVTLKNVGETSISDLSLEAMTPDGTILVDPGALFGNSRRHVRVRTLTPQQKITYKLGLRVREGFTSGTLNVRLAIIRVGASKEEFEVRTPLVASNVN